MTEHGMELRKVRNSSGIKRIIRSDYVGDALRLRA